MIQSKSKFPLWTIVITGILWILVTVAVILVMYNAHHEVFASPFGSKSPFAYLKIEHVIAIATIITTAIIATANIILVAVTNFYAVQTKKMVDQHHQTRKDDLRPLFIPQEYGYKGTGNDIYFEFVNAGNVALYVNMYLGKKRICFANHLDPWSTISSITLNKSDLINKKRAAELSAIICIAFWDKALNQYKQYFEFDWNREEFVFNNSCLPLEQREEKE